MGQQKEELRDQDHSIEQTSQTSGKPIKKSTSKGKQQKDEITAQENQAAVKKSTSKGKRQKEENTESKDHSREETPSQTSGKSVNKMSPKAREPGISREGSQLSFKPGISREGSQISLKSTNK